MAASARSQTNLINPLFGRKPTSIQAVESSSLNELTDITRLTKLCAKKNTTNKAKGQCGEDVAAQYLESLGWYVLARNWRCAEGELDLCAIEPADGCYPIAVTVEVKLRTSRSYGSPLEAITVDKLSRLRKLSTIWVNSLEFEVSKLRIDAIGILKVTGSAPQIRHIRGLS